MNKQILIDQDLFLDMVEFIFYPERIDTITEIRKQSIKDRALDKLRRIDAHNKYTPQDKHHSL